MIARLSGQLLFKKAPLILIDCHGVGYELEVSMNTFCQLPELQQAVSLWTHLLIREDHHSLIGFYDEAERTLFRQLIRVNGVGPKLALVILSGMSATEFAQCVHNNQISGLTRLPGVGKKTAERLIIEMRDKLDAPGTTPAATPRSSTGSVNIQQEALEALQALGYKPADAEKMLRPHQNQSDNVGELIRLALQSSLR